MAITLGSRLEARTAYDETIHMRALGAPEQGGNVTVVWVCTEGEWAKAQEESREPEGLPWPLTAIREPQTA